MQKMEIVSPSRKLDKITLETTPTIKPKKP